MQAALQASELTYRTLFETVPQGIVYHDPQGRITSANPAAQRILGLTLQQMQGLTAMDPRWGVTHEDGSPFPGEQHPVSQTLRTGRPVRDVVMGVCVPDREKAWILVNATPVVQDGVLTAVYASFEDITQRVLLDQVLQRQAQTDELTGAANRRMLMQRLSTEFERVRRYPQVGCAVLALDLDHFKRVNDCWGHAAGDAVLRHVVHLLQQQLRATDLLARSGGEEFVVLLPDTSLAEASRLAERLRRTVQAKPTRFGEQMLPITTSIGLAVIEHGDASPEAVLARADAALYEAKADGRNTVHGFAPLV
jgi:diguanylate cyclase (GGDEF)-like protein/PAS domain S-box-containing protein